MSKDKEGKEVNSGSENVSLSMTELQTLITSAVSAAVSGQSQVIADAIKEGNKPYEDPNVIQNQKNMRNQMRDQQQAIRNRIRAAQNTCPHLQGCNPLSDSAGTKTSIVKHQFDTGVVLGICTNCNRIFKPTDPDYFQQMQRPSGNKMSIGGQRFISAPAAAVADLMIPEVTE